MAERLQGFNPLEIAGVVGAGVAAGLVGVSFITMRDHREITHESVELDPRFQVLIDIEHRTYGVRDPRVWGAVHQIHHSTADVALFPTLRIARALKWLERNPHRAQNIDIPRSYPHLDPYIDSVSIEHVMVIGALAEELLRERFGDRYEEPEDYPDEQELYGILHPREPQYFYYGYERHKGEYTFDQKAELLLQDPHSPALIGPPQKNGVRGVAIHNIPLYIHLADLFYKHPELMPKYLQREDGTIRRGNKSLDWLMGFAIPTAAVFLARGKFTWKDFARAVVEGSVINGIKIGVEMLGGNITNSFGHAGTITEPLLLEAIASGQYKPRLNPDGSLSTDTETAGFWGKLLSILTLDEVGGQDVHHRHPEYIAYTEKNGWKAWMEAPWGMFLATLAHSKLCPVIKPGKGFQLQEGERRPDVPNEAVEIIQRLRVEQMRTEQLRSAA